MSTKYFISGPNASCTITFDDLFNETAMLRRIEELIVKFCMYSGDDPDDYTATNLTELEKQNAGD